MTKKDLLNRIEELEETMMMTFDCFDTKLNNLKSVQGTVTHQIQTMIQPLVNNLAVLEKRVNHNAELSRLLVEYLGLTFYEINESKRIEVREKAINKDSKRKGRPSTSRVGKKKV